MNFEEMRNRPGNIYKMAKIKEIIDIIYMFRSKLVDVIYIKWSNPVNGGTK